MTKKGPCPDCAPFLEGEWIDAPERMPRFDEAETISVALSKRLLKMLRSFASRRRMSLSALMAKWLDAQIRIEAPKEKIMSMKRFNGFLYYDRGETCAGCGFKQEGDPEAKPGDYPDDFGGFYLECPECYAPGCDECIIGGRGCLCTECEENR